MISNILRMLGVSATACMILVLPQGCALQQPSLPFDEELLNAWIEEARERWGAPGLAAAAVNEGNVVWTYASGVNNVDTMEPVTPHTIFAIGSATKTFTGTIAADLHVKGELDIDRPVTDYRPDIVFPTDELNSKATLRDLLSHRTGVAGNNLMFWGVEGLDRETLTSRIRFLPTLTSLRGGYAYQNTMYAIAGDIAARAATNGDWRSLTTDEILKPLGMNRTTLNAPETASFDNVADAHATIDGHIRVIPLFDGAVIAAAGSIHSSALDMSRWVTMLLGEGQFQGHSVLRATAIREAWKNANSVPMTSQEALLAPGATTLEYGLGWFIQDYGDVTIVHHGGSSDGQVAKLLLVPELDLGVVVLVNALSFALPEAVSYRVVDLFLGRDPEPVSEQLFGVWSQFAPLTDQKSFQPPTAPYTLPPNVLAHLPGRYSSGLYGDAVIGIDAKGKLGMSLLNHEAAVYPVSESQYAVDWGEDRLKQQAIPSFSLVPGPSHEEDVLVIGGVRFLRVE